MDARVWLILLIIFVLLVVVGLWFYWQRRRTRRLRSLFGSEYDRAVQEVGDRRQAEALLMSRRKHVERLAIQPLMRTDRERFSQEWQSCQARFVDDPKGAVKEADHLVAEVMGRRGYPMGDFEQRAADISVGHPGVVRNYRAAHEIAVREQRGKADTEELRRALIYYKTLFDELLGMGEPVLKEAK
jgi:hypothetical protein